MDSFILLLNQSRGFIDLVTKADLDEDIPLYFGYPCASDNSVLIKLAEFYNLLFITCLSYLDLNLILIGTSRLPVHLHEFLTWGDSIYSCRVRVCNYKNRRISLISFLRATSKFPPRRAASGFFWEI